MNTEAVRLKRQEIKDLERAMAELPYTAEGTARADLQAQWQQKHQEFLDLLKEDSRKSEAEQEAKHKALDAAQKEQMKKQLEGVAGLVNEIPETQDSVGETEPEEEVVSALKTKNKTKNKAKG